MSKNTGLEIAVIGMAGRFPKAGNIEEYWKNLTQSLESISFFSDEELLQNGVSAEELQNPLYVKASSYLDNKEFFDSAFFGYRPDEAKLMDPQMRIFHECVWSAIENAGININNNNNIGLFTSASPNLNWQLYSKLINSNGLVDALTASQLDNSNFLSSRISYLLNFVGPSIFMDTACSSSLVCIHNACRSLLLSDCYIAIAGGVRVSNASKKGYIYQPGLINSKDGHCCPFDKTASGTINSEGVGVVVLKKLSDAIKDGDRIDAIIKGIGVNNDGNDKIGYAAPSINGQVEVILKALKWAKVESESIGCIEAHGTGTVLGDPIEFEALSRVFGRSENPYCALGSVKSNIGHTDVASGVAGLIKMVLSLKHKQIPASINFTTPNPKINFSGTPFYVNTELRGWKRGKYPLRAGVSSFGIGGTNAHVILEEAPLPPASSEGRDHQLLVLSAKTPAALERNAENFIAYLRNNREEKFADIAYTLQVGRIPFAYRRVVVCKDPEEAIVALSSSDASAEPTLSPDKGAKALVFMFSGQGSQYPGMCQGLYEKEESFRSDVDRCFEIVKQCSGKALKPVIYSCSEADKSIDSTEFTQPALFVIEYALTRLLMRWGIRPSLMIGHSIGEYVAACISGVFSLEDALALVTRRGELMQKVQRGTMLSISIPEAELRPLLSNAPDVSLAAVNSSELCVVSGAEGAIARFRAILETQGYVCTVIRTSHAFHSYMMDGILDEFEREVRSVRINKQQIPFISNLTGSPADDAEISMPQYWVRHLRETVRFSEGVETVFSNKNAIFIEVGPGNVLETFVRSNRCREKGHKVVSLVRHPKENADDLKCLLSGVGELWLNGVEPSWGSFYEKEVRKKVSLPTYSFEKTKYPVVVNAFKMISERLSAKAEDVRKNINEWYYVPTWKLSLNNKSSFTTTKDYSYLIFEDGLEICSSLITKLSENKGRIIRVSSGSKFSRHSPNHYFINPEIASDYIELFSNLNTTNNLPDHIIHGFGITENLPKNLTEEEFISYSNIFFHSLVHIVKAAQKYGGILGKQIHVLTNDLHHIYQPDGYSAVKSMVIGLLKVIPQEYPSTNCKHIDISLEEKNSLGFIENIYQEIVNDKLDKTVLLKHSKRWVQTFEKITTLNKDESCFKAGGVYLITGGLGFLGYTISCHLAKNYQAKLIVLGKTNLPEQNEWESYLKQENADKSIVEKIRKLQALQTESTEVLYINCDLSSSESFSEAIKRAEETIGKVNGIIHAAGVTKGKSMNSINLLEYSDYSEQFKPKITGLEILIDNFKNRDLDFCLIFSSLSAILGGLGFGAYSSANVYLDYRINALRGKGLLNNWLTIDFEKGKSSMVMSDKEIIEVVEQRIHLKDYSQVIISMTDLEKRVAEWVLSRGEVESELTFDSGKGEEDSRVELTKVSEKGLSKTEERLIILWQKFFNILGINVFDDFFEIGGDSLKGLTMTGLIHKEFGVELSITDFFRNSSIKRLGTLIDSFDKTEYVKIELTPKKDYYKLSSAQRRLLFLHEFDRSSLAYNIAQVVKLEGDIDNGKLYDAFNKLIDRHESFRTSFEIVNDVAVQKISGQVTFDIEYFNSKEDEVKQIIKNFIRPFDLNKAPLLRVGLIEVQPQEHILMVDMHHIISDGVSQGILIKDFMSFYNNEVLPELDLQYKDYSEWQQSEKQQERISKQEKFWLNEFVEEVVALELSTNFKRPPVKSYEGNIVSFNLSTEETCKLKLISEAEGATLYMVLLSIYNVLLSKLSNQEDIVVGTPIAGRGHSDLENIIGMFVNTLPLRNFPKGELSFKKFLSEVKNKTLACFENQSYQYEELIDKLKVVRDTSRNPLFDVMFVFQNFEREELKILGLTLKPYYNEHTVSKFDLALTAEESQGQIFFTFEYSTGLFRKETIDRFIEYFRKIVSNISENQNKKLSDIEIISEKEKQQLLYEFNNTKAFYPKDKTIIKLFEDQVEQNPKATAVTFGDQKLTYLELNNNANQLGRLLKGKGVTRNSIVAIMAERSLEMIVGIYGILKAGGAYLPIDPVYPESRIKFMIDNSNATIILTQERFINTIKDGFDLVNLTDESTFQGNVDNLSVNTPDDLAYVIYTSGSTGNPKGVMIKHGSLVNRLNWMQKIYPLESDDVVLHKTPFTFDVSVWEIFWWSMVGSKVNLLKPGGEKEPDTIVKAIEEQKVTVLHFVPSMFGVFLDHIAGEEKRIRKISSIKHVITSGEALLPIHVEKFNNTLRKANRSKLANLYGPTEATVDVTYFNCPEEGAVNVVPIGKPIDNTTIFILDSNLNITPIGVAGELCIGGVGLAKGYLNNEKLTNEKFIPSPFGEGRLYRTGDLARWLPDGNIEYLGRIDHQVKIRGNRIELGEIETTLTKHEKIKEAIVKAMGVEGEKYLCAYIISEDELETGELRAYLSESLPDYMLPSYFIRLEKMPLSSNGKIDRKALPEPEIKAGGEYVPPSNDIEEKLVAIWSEVLKIEKEQISVSRSFFELGGHSLNAMIIISMIEKEFNVKLKLLTIFNKPTIRDVSRNIIITNLSMNSLPEEINNKITI